MPISGAIKVVATNVKRGECFVRISLRIEGQVVSLLAAGYVSSTNGLTYPGGRIESSTEGRGLIRVIQGTNPAAGVEISETVPTGVRWRLISVHAVLVNDATVSTRIISLVITSNAVDTARLLAGGALTANQTGRHTWDSGGVITGASTPSLQGCIAIDLFLEAGVVITTSTINLQAGDNWGAPSFRVEEWIEP